MKKLSLVLLISLGSQHIQAKPALNSQPTLSREERRLKERDEGLQKFLVAEIEKYRPILKAYDELNACKKSEYAYHLAQLKITINKEVDSGKFGNKGWLNLPEEGDEYQPVYRFKVFLINRTVSSLRLKITKLKNTTRQKTETETTKKAQTFIKKLKELKRLLSS